MIMESKAPRKNKRERLPRDVLVSVIRAANIVIPTINSGIDSVL